MAGAEVTFIDFDLAGFKRTFGFAEVSDSWSNTFENTIDALSTYSGQSCNL
jgi:hypothetical protein